MLKDILEPPDYVRVSGSIGGQSIELSNSSRKIHPVRASPTKNLCRAVVASREIRIVSKFYVRLCDFGQTFFVKLKPGGKMPHFQQIDVYALEAELEVSDKGGKQGRQNKPKNSETSLDEPQSGIVNAFTDLLNAARTKGEGLILGHERTRKNTELRSAVNALDTLTTDTVMEVQRAKGDHRDNLMSLRTAERMSLRERNYFQHVNDLHREADYPESDIMHWSIVAALVITESLANSYFFAKGSDLGLLGGAFQALLISAVNIGAALLAGVYLMRNLHHQHRGRQLAASAGLAVYIGFLCFFNLATAHYRAALELDPTTALLRTFSRLMESPLGINDFDASILLFIGIIFSVFGLIKAYRADDVYPGYGKIDRQYQTADENYLEGKKELRDALKLVFDHSRAKLHELVSNARDGCDKFDELIADSKNVIGEFIRHQDEMNKACHQLLTTYRQANQQTRTSQTPKYFEIFPTLGDSQGLPHGTLVQDEELGVAIRAELDQLENGAKGVVTGLAELHEKSLSEVETFFLEVEEETDERVTRDTSFGAEGKL
jgi:hypothetical protein